MNVVGKVGTLISQGVYSVATPFHPFGGAVDIIVVEQEDGTYRSTPWYVRFGKFQGVIKGAEKIVTITVNGVDANFHMLLDSSGQAYFMREVSGSDDQENKHSRLESGQDENFDHSIDGHGEHVQDDEEASSSSRFNSYHYGNLEEVEDVVKSSDEINSEMVIVSVDGHVLTAPISANEKNTGDLQLDNPQFHLGPGEGTGQEFSSGGDIWEDGLYVPMDACSAKEEDGSENLLEGPTDCKRVSFHGEQAESFSNHEGRNSSEEIAAIIDNGDMFKSCLDLTLHLHERDIPFLVDQSQDSTLKENTKQSPNSSCTAIVGSETSTTNDEVETLNSRSVEMKDMENIFSANFKQSEIQICSDDNLCISDQPQAESLTTLDNIAEACGDILAVNMLQTSVNGNLADHMRFEISLCGNILCPGMGTSAAAETFDAHRISEDEFKASGQSIIKSGNLIVRYKEMYLPWDKATQVVLGKAVYGPHFSCEIMDSILINSEEMTTRVDAQIASPSSFSSSRRWRLWPNPFRRDRTLKHSNNDSSNEDLFVDTESDVQTTNTEQNPSNSSPRKQYFRTYIPTTEQIASLNLKDGQNMVAFSFSTRVLGKQQVDAHIYLWKWNARIVISDVDVVAKISVQETSLRRNWEGAREVEMDCAEQIGGRWKAEERLAFAWGLEGRQRCFGGFWILQAQYCSMGESAREEVSRWAVVQLLDDVVRCDCSERYDMEGETGAMGDMARDAVAARSDVLGQVMPLVGKDWTQYGVARLFSAIKDGKALPTGPVVISPDGLFPSLYREEPRSGLRDRYSGEGKGRVSLCSRNRSPAPAAPPPALAGSPPVSACARPRAGARARLPACPPTRTKSARTRDCPRACPPSRLPARAPHPRIALPGPRQRRSACRRLPPPAAACQRHSTAGRQPIRRHALADRAAPARRAPPVPACRRAARARRARRPRPPVSPPPARVRAACRRARARLSAHLLLTCSRVRRSRARLCPCPRFVCTLFAHPTRSDQ
ncbi:phosphatidate phosphatase LPIN [Apostasia shenzhenica]|uniref:phosphatidate phosphatase n=1 Tax=Apostasia shenzhenica TaxID=1088818 RepID=A0A2I0B656_9ASPA|nr:phosphatidate phosphatase LPIN [Apostasia shenzhenica]